MMKHNRTYSWVVFFVNISWSIDIREVIHVHSPTCFNSFGCFPSVKYKCFLYTLRLGFTDWFMCSSDIPITGSCSTSLDENHLVFAVSRCEEVPRETKKKQIPEFSRNC